MLTILDLNAELAKLKMLRGRTPETPPADREGAFARLAPYRDSAINASKFSGDGPWERHPNGDEIVQVLSGVCNFVLDLESGPQTIQMHAGQAVIVPKGVWHTAKVHQPTEILHITFGEGTQFRPVEQAH